MTDEEQSGERASALEHPRANEEEREDGAALDAALERGIAQADAGELIESDVAVDELLRDWTADL